MADSQNNNHDFDDGNVIRFKPRTSEKKEKPPQEPLFNLPVATKYLAGLLIAVHIVLFLVLNETQRGEAVLMFGFISGRFTGREEFELLALITPLTHMFIHGSILHIAMNLAMLLAFGSGVEKWLGVKRFLIVYFGSAFFGLLFHFIFNFYTLYPVIGASGGISGLFAAALIMLYNSKAGLIGQSKYGLWPVIALWVGITLLFGLMGSPDGNIVSWEAHLGGFLGGFIMIKFLLIFMPDR